MTRLTIAEDSGEEFAIRGQNTIADDDDDEIVFYANVTKVHVLPEPGIREIRRSHDQNRKACAGGTTPVGLIRIVIGNRFNDVKKIYRIANQ